MLDVGDRVGAWGYDHRAITVSDAAAAGQQSVVILNIRIGVKRDRGDVVDALHGPAVQRFNITERMREAQSGHANLVGGESVKHECIIGVGAVSNRDFANVGGLNASRILAL